MPVDISTLDIAPPPLPISASNPLALGLNGNCNGQQASSPPHALDSAWNGQVFDFHGGIYNQIDFTPSTPAEDGSACIISQLSLSHA